MAAKKKEKYRPVLFGVAHHPRFCLNYIAELSDFIDKPGIKSVALELPPLKEGTPYAEAVTLNNVFFDLAKFAKKWGWRVNYIDSRLGLERTASLTTALALSQFPEKRKEIEKIMAAKKPGQWKARQIERVSQEPEPAFNLKIYERALKALETKSPEQLFYELANVTKMRDNFMLKQIRRKKPDIILIGHSHAVNLAPKLRVKMRDPGGLGKKLEGKMGLPEVYKWMKFFIKRREKERKNALKPAKKPGKKPPKNPENPNPADCYRLNGLITN